MEKIKYPQLSSGSSKPRKETKYPEAAQWLGSSVSVGKLIARDNQTDRFGRRQP
jgi:hypothetical protein